MQQRHRLVVDGPIEFAEGVGGNTDRRHQATVLEGLPGVAAAWQSNFDANVLTAVLTTEVMKARLADGARVVTIGSIAAAKQAPDPMARPFGARR